jgi:hypothetical protein
MSSIKTFEGACRKLNIIPEDIIMSFPAGMEQHAKQIAAHYKLVIIAAALNNGWKPDWTNGKWDKYYPYFTMGDATGNDFAFEGIDERDMYSGNSASLCYRSSEIAYYAGTKFISLYKDYLLSV